MSATAHLLSFGLRSVLGTSAEPLTAAIERRLADHGEALPKALGRANDRAWEAVGLALAGDSWLDRLKDVFRDGDLKGVRDQIRSFLADTPTGLESAAATVRVKATEEWLRLRKAKAFYAGATPPAELARRAASLERYADPAGLTAAAHRAVADTAEALRAAAPHLAGLLTAAPAGGTPLLVAAFAFFFRRELETDAELARGLSFDLLRRIGDRQDQGFALLDGRTAGILDQLDLLFDELADIRAKLDKLLDDRDVTTGVRDPLRVSVTNEKELAQLRTWRDELRAFPPDFVPSADWGKLGDALAAARMFAEAREAHAASAKAAADRSARAEAEYKAYRDACEQEAWADALPALVRAAELDPARFAPFPLNRYEPVRVLGAGGFGTVIRCRQRLAKGREVAVKTFHAADLGREVDEVFAEAHALSELADPAIVKILHWEFADADESRPYLVMEYFPGVSLAAHLKTHGPLAVADLVAVARQVAEAMDVAHAARVLHRDLKPGNVLVRRYGDRWDVRVIDFGLAVKFAAVQASVSTSLPQRTRREQSFAGTLEYASPEQKGLVRAEVGPRSDVYSFGKTMLEALLGTTEPTARTWRAVSEEFRDALRDLLEQCVERNPADRHPGFGSVAAALAALDPADRANRERLEREASERRRREEEAERAKIAAAEAARVEAERKAAGQERARREQVDRERAERMRRWEQSGRPREWVAAHPDGWTPAQWTALVNELKSSPHWPLKGDEVESLLVRLRDELRAEQDRARADEAARRKAEEEAERKRLAEEAARKKAEEEVKARDPLHPGRVRSAGETVTLTLPGDVPMTFAWCPPGTYRMGSDHPEAAKIDHCKKTERPVHAVTLTKGFFMGIHQVTQAQWKAVMGTAPSYFKGPNRPVEQVSWDDCQEFCAKFTTALKGRVTVRLPMEAEWEYACRAGTTTEFWFGDVINTDLANYDGNDQWNGSPKGKYRQQTTEVGSFGANPWGLYDVHGNVWEWCRDAWDEAFYQKSPDRDPICDNAQEVRRVLRGGSWGNNPIDCRAAYRCRFGRDVRGNDVGCRVCFQPDI